MDPFIIIGPIIFICLVVVVVKYIHGMNNISDGGYSYQGKMLPKDVQDKWQATVNEKIDREKRAKQRREKAKRYWEGYEDDDDD